MNRVVYAANMRRNLLGGLVLAFVSLASVGAAAQARPETSANPDAARLFDEGVLRFQRQEYAAAAQAFLAADALVPNPEALKDAIASALQAHDQVLIARAMDRALRRPDIGEEMATAARTALAEALQSVASIEVQCSPRPCSIQLDGMPVPPGTSYALAGTHVLVSEGANGMRASAQLNCVAGASYRLTLQLTPADEPVSELQRPPLPAALPAQTPRAKPTHSAKSDRVSNKPLSPLVFIVGGVGTVALAGLTTWSGLEALSAKALHESQPDAYDPNQVRIWQRRTDYLLLGTLLLGVATGAAGLWWVDWGPSHGRSVSIVPNGLGLVAHGRF
jgi:hypothetical protein